MHKKDYWVSEINSRLNGKQIDIHKARTICAEIEAGMADIDDANK